MGKTKRTNTETSATYNDAKIKGNETEEFLKRMVLKIIISTVVLIAGVGIAAYNMRGI
jgi:hypothetical protein